MNSEIEIVRRPLMSPDQRCNLFRQFRSLARSRGGVLVNFSLLVDEDVSRDSALLVSDNMPHVCNEFRIGAIVAASKLVDLDALSPAVGPLRQIN